MTENDDQISVADPGMCGNAKASEQKDSLSDVKNYQEPVNRPSNDEFHASQAEKLLKKPHNLVDFVLQLVKNSDIEQALIEINRALEIDAVGVVFGKRSEILNAITSAVKARYSGGVHEKFQKEVAKLASMIEVKERNLDVLKTAIVETLEQRPNRSCKRDSLSAQVLRTVSEDLRGRNRKNFEARATMALARLRKAKVVEQYRTARNIRVRLKDNYSTHFERLKSRWARQLKKAIDESSDHLEFPHYADPYRETKLDETQLSKDKLIRGIQPDDLAFKLPDLPDPVDPYFFETPFDKDASDQNFDHDDETIKLLGILTNNKAEGTRSLDEQEQEIQKQWESADVLKYLQTEFENNPYFEFRRFLNTLQITVKLSSKPFTLEIEYQPEFNRILLKAFFEIVRRTVSDLLDLSGKDDFTSTIGTTIINGKRVYVVRKTTSIFQMKPTKLRQLITQSLSEMVKVNEIIQSSNPPNGI